jgi:hypothetical protein
MRILIALAVAGLAGTASATRLEHVGTVTAATSPAALHAVGDARYIALNELTCPEECLTDILDVTTLDVHRITIRRDALERKFGHPSGRYRALGGQVASYTPTRTGLFLHDDDAGTTRYTYAEVDSKTGRIVRAVDLGTSSGKTDMYFVGTDSERGDAWFSVEEYSGPRESRLGFRRAKSAKSITFRRVDLGTFAVTDETSVALSERAQSGPLEIQLTVHPADDFSRFAVVEYWEDPFPLSPAGNVYVIDVANATSFAIPTLPVTYGAVFSRDGKYLYLSSSQTGAVERVDLATHKIDQQVTGPKLVHHLAIAPDDGSLIALGSSAHYVTFDLPKLAKTRELTHDKRLAPAFESLFGGGVVARYGGYVVVAQPSGPKWSTTRDFVVARVVK